MTPARTYQHHARLRLVPQPPPRPIEEPVPTVVYVLVGALVLLSLYVTRATIAAVSAWCWS